jgi:hypothetical protein
MKRRRIERAQRAPKGLAAFLGRITGINLITKKLHKYRDRKRFEALLADRDRLQDRQKQARLAMRRESCGRWTRSSSANGVHSKPRS